MTRLAALLIAGAAFAAAPAEARMAKTVLFSTSPALGLDGDGGGEEIWSPSVKPVGFVEWMREFARPKPARSGQAVRNDMTETLDAMQIARIGFAESRRCAAKQSPAR